MSTLRTFVLASLAASSILAFGVVAVGADVGPRPCSGHDLSGLFYVVPGSAGAGQISYALRIRNRSLRTCFVSGLPGIRLLGKNGQPLPSRVWPAHRGALTAVRVVLAPRGYGVATARFSPDVPGAGEQTIGPCERTAFRARVTPPGGGSGTFVVRITPPTPVCEKGRLVFSVVVAVRTSHG